MQRDEMMKLAMYYTRFFFVDRDDAVEWLLKNFTFCGQGRVSSRSLKKRHAKSGILKNFKGWPGSSRLEVATKPRNRGLCQPL